MKPLGQRIKEELERQERTVSWFAQKLMCNRANVYNIFMRESIDTALLMRISKVLHYNFFKEMSDEAERDEYLS